MPIKDMSQEVLLYPAAEEGVLIPWLETEDHGRDKKCSIIFRSLANPNEYFFVTGYKNSVAWDIFVSDGRNDFLTPGLIESKRQS